MRQSIGRSSRKQPGSIRIQASLDQSAFLSVFQQGVAFVIVNLGEGIYTRSQLEAASKGRPSIGILLLSNVALVAGLYLLAMGQTKAGLAVGTTTSAALLLLDIKRAYDVEDDPKEWPGPKAWPATLALISFFAVNVFGQALLRV
ncbi:g11563 [Coccomyxa viridis]|uniref:G11563 protein n=1 Tax=Coccomyxa viridis TaxID=1274662 RepID=A0ABP1GCX6_9CHLO